VSQFQNISVNLFENLSLQNPQTKAA